METQITRNTEWKEIPYKTKVGQVVDLAQTVTIDKTLTVTDAAADAKIVGDRLNSKLDLSGGVVSTDNDIDSKTIIDSYGLSGNSQGWDYWKLDNKSGILTLDGRIEFPALKSGNITPYFNGATFNIGMGSNGSLNLPFVTDGKNHDLALVDDISASVNPVLDPSFNIKVATIAGKDIKIPKASSTTIRRWYN